MKNILNLKTLLFSLITGGGIALFTLTQSSDIPWQEATFTDIEREGVSPWQNSRIDSIDVEKNIIHLSKFIRDSGLDRQWWKSQLQGDLTPYLKRGDSITLRNFYYAIDGTNRKDYLYESEHNGKAFKISDIVYDPTTGRTLLTIDGDLVNCFRCGTRVKNNRTGRDEGIRFLNREGFLITNKNFGKGLKNGDTLMIYGGPYYDGESVIVKSFSRVIDRTGTGSYWMINLKDNVSTEIMFFQDKINPVAQFEARSSGRDILYDLMIPDGQLSNLTLYYPGGEAKVIGTNEYGDIILDSTDLEESYFDPTFGTLMLKFRDTIPAGRFYMDYTTTKISGPDNKELLQELLNSSGLVEVPHGHYLSSSGIYLPDNTKLKGGEGLSFLHQQFSPMAMAKNFITSANDTTRNTRFNKRTKNISIEGLTIIGLTAYPDKERLNITKTSNAHTINIKHSENFKIQDSRVESAVYDCIYGGGNGYNGDGFLVENTLASRAGRNCFTITGFREVESYGSTYERDGILAMGLQQTDYGVRGAFGAKMVDMETNGPGDEFDLRFIGNLVQYANYAAMGISPRRGGRVTRGVSIMGNQFYANRDLHLRYGTGTSENSIVMGNVFRGGRLGIDINGHNVISIQGNTFGTRSAFRVATVNNKSYGMIISGNTFSPGTEYNLKPGNNLYEDNLIIHNGDEIEGGPYK